MYKLVTMIVMGLSASCYAQVNVLSLQAISVGSDTVFVVEIERPDDMNSIAENRWGRRGDPWPSTPRLETEDPRDAPCALEIGEFDTRGMRNVAGPLVFVGKTSSADRLSMTLHYLAVTDDSTTWRELPLSIALNQADALAADPPPLHRWARAQAAWFDMLNDHIDEPFFSFASQQMLRSAGIDDEERRENARRWNPGAPDDRLYELVSGSIAVQESLQLDRMLEPVGDRGTRSASLSDIQGVSIVSHPFDQMRGDAEPVHSSLAAMVPADNYYAHFNSLRALHELIDFTDLWGPSLLQLAAAQGRDYESGDRMRTQLCLPDTLFSRTLGPLVVGGVALTGSDPFMRDGSDLTVLFAVKNRLAFLAGVDPHIAAALRDVPDAAQSKREYQGVSIDIVTDPRRTISCYRAWIDDVCVYGNSLAGLHRVIDAHAGTLTAMADAPDFKYMRAKVYPLSAQAEDGFLFLSDPFIRRLVGPELRIKQLRRVEALASMRMITNASLYHGYYYGQSATLDELFSSASLEPADLYDPQGGTFAWDPGESHVSSSVWGGLRFMTPLIEIDIDRVTQSERDAYEAFRDQYQNYWSQFFDPIGVRFQIGEDVRIQTHILPLIETSGYNSLRDMVGGSPTPIDIGAFAQNTVLRVVARVNRQGIEFERFRDIAGTMIGAAATEWVGDWVTLWLEDSTSLRVLTAEAFDEDSDLMGDEFFDLSIVAGAQVTNKLSLAAFLVGMKNTVDVAAPNTVVFTPLEPYQDVTIVRISPDPRATFAKDLGAGDSDDPDDGPAVYYATIGDAFYVSLQLGSLQALIDRVFADQPNEDIIEANVLLYASPESTTTQGESWRDVVSPILEKRARDASRRGLALIWLLERCGALDGTSVQDAARTRLGYRIVCPDGGEYVHANRELRCSIHGTLEQPERIDSLPDGSPIAALLRSIRTIVTDLRFTDDGIETGVMIDR